jgi:hypothetical protein
VGLTLVASMENLMTSLVLASYFSYTRSFTITRFPFPVPIGNGILRRLRESCDETMLIHRLAPTVARPGLRPHPALRPALAVSLMRPQTMALVRQPTARAWESTVNPEPKDHGHISVQPNESVLFFNSKPLSPASSRSWRSLTPPFVQTYFPSSLAAFSLVP